MNDVDEPDPPDDSEEDDVYDDEEAIEEPTNLSDDDDDDDYDNISTDDTSEQETLSIDVAEHENKFEVVKIREAGDLLWERGVACCHDEGICVQSGGRLYTCRECGLFVETLPRTWTPQDNLCSKIARLQPIIRLFISKQQTERHLFQDTTRSESGTCANE